jgi:hypothetical protein
MIDFGWVRRFSHKGQQVAECLNFFGVATIDAWRERYAEYGAAFRASQTFEKDGPAVGAWLRQAERACSEIDCQPFDQSAFKLALAEARALTHATDPAVFVPRLVDICRTAGTAVVLVPAPRGCPVSGAAQWLAKDRAMIALSLRHKTNDHLWFSFFHEAGHIALHGKRMQFVDADNGLESEYEHEADAFAMNWLIPPEAASELNALPRSEDSVRWFAERVGIAPGIVVGRMQKEGLLPWTHLNRLKVRYHWSHEIE